MCCRVTPRGGATWATFNYPRTRPPIAFLIKLLSVSIITLAGDIIILTLSTLLKLYDDYQVIDPQKDKEFAAFCQYLLP